MKDSAAKDSDSDDGLEIVEVPACQPLDLRAFYKFEGNTVVQQKLNEFSLHKQLAAQNQSAADSKADLAD